MFENIFKGSPKELITSSGMKRVSTLSIMEKILKSFCSMSEAAAGRILLW